VLEHDDANRGLIGANMRGQAVPLLGSAAPLVGTGMEKRIAIDAGDSITDQKPGVVTEGAADMVTVMEDEGSTRHYPVYKFQRSNTGNAYNQVVRVSEGERVEFGAVIADGPATDNGELALGKNLL